jgi:hypothetical protein
MSMIIQGRQLSDNDIESIRSLLATHPDWHRSRLSIELCRLWNWRTDKGLLKDMACRSMLRKLEQRRLIVLPPSRYTVTRRRRLIRDVAHSTETIQADLQTLCPLELVIVDGRNEAAELFHCLMDRYHYLGCRGHVGEHIKYMVCDRRKRPLACLLFEEILGTFYIPLVKNFFNRCYYRLLRCHPGDWAHLTTRYFEGSASFSPFGELTA